MKDETPDHPPLPLKTLTPVRVDHAGAPSGVMLVALDARGRPWSAFLPDSAKHAAAPWRPLF